MPPPKVVKEKSPGAFEKHRSFCFFTRLARFMGQGVTLKELKDETHRVPVVTEVADRRIEIPRAEVHAVRAVCIA